MNFRIVTTHKATQQEVLQIDRREKKKKRKIYVYIYSVHNGHTSSRSTISSYKIGREKKETETLKAEGKD